MASCLSVGGLRAATQADILSTAGAAALLGVLFHQGIRKVEFELFMYHFIFASIAVGFGLVYTFISLGGHSIVSALLKTFVFASSFNFGLLASIGTYRLFFHRCRRFPGPLGAKLSRFYATNLSAKDVQYYKELSAMHEKYGDFVRTGMGHQPCF